jgi:hypothetical protein
MKKYSFLARLLCGNFVAFTFISLFVQSCTPRVEVAAPEKPITINLNIKIDHEVRVKVDKELDKVISTDSDLF